MSDELAEIVRMHWNWAGIEPESVTAISPFGHLIVKDRAATFWYIDPELREAKAIAASEEELFAYMTDDEVRLTWEASVLVEAAEKRLGKPSLGQCYSLKPHALLSGDYSRENLCILPIVEVIGWTGDVERQLRELPPGAKYQLKVID